MKSIEGSTSKERVTRFSGYTFIAAPRIGDNRLVADFADSRDRARNFFAADAMDIRRAALIF
jgi:hypothetical protein